MGTMKQALVAIVAAVLLASSATAESIVGLHAEAIARCEARGGNVPETTFKTDGCSCWIDDGWRECCILHDMDYWCGGTMRERWESDRRLAACVGVPMGEIMFMGVFTFGGSWWPHPARWGYGHPWPSAGGR